MKILELSLTYHWYDEIKAGNKYQEYRKISPYYIYRFIDRSKIPHERWIKTVAYRIVRGNSFVPSYYEEGFGYLPYKHYDYVRFRRGRFGSETSLYRILGIKVGFGDKKQGAPDESVFIISIGDEVHDFQKDVTN